MAQKEELSLEKGHTPTLLPTCQGMLKHFAWESTGTKGINKLSPFVELSSILNHWDCIHNISAGI